MISSAVPGTSPRGSADTVRIMVAEDQTMVRQALVALLGLEDDITVVAQAASGGEAIAMAHRHQPEGPHRTSTRGRFQPYFFNLLCSVARSMPSTSAVRVWL